MRELSLFTGAGGGLLGTHHLLGWETVGYVEIEDYCQRVIKQRIADGLLPEAPIFGDIRAFISEGYAASYTGMVDVITGGFPCQDISCANHKATGIKGERSGLWKEMYKTISIVKPRYVFVENSPMLTIRGLGAVLRDLASMGFDAEWGVLGGGCTNSCCEGERAWIFAFEANSPMLEGMDIPSYRLAYSEESCRRQYTRAIGAMLSQDDYSRVKRDHDEVARGMDRLKAIGNGQDPIVAATAWHILTQNFFAPKRTPDAPKTGKVADRADEKSIA